MVYEPIKCQMFKGWEADMNALAVKLGKCGGKGPERARLAGKLRLEADSLLACRDHNAQCQDCGNCRAVALRRKRLAELNVKKKAGLVLHLAGQK